MSLIDIDLAITVYYDDPESPDLLALVRELDDLGVGYDECRFDEMTSEVRDLLTSRAGGALSSPLVVINDDVLVRPASAAVMSAILHARTGGFYQ